MQNIADGHSVVAIGKAYFCNNTDVSKKDSVRVLLNPIDGTYTESVDYLVFQSLIEENSDPSDLLQNMMTKHKNFANAIPDIVSSGI